MKQYIIRRILISILILFGVSLIIYALIRMMPGDYVDIATANLKDVTPAMKEHFKHLYGLDKGILEGYIDWVVKMFHGDFGNSWVYGYSVVKVFSRRVMISFTLNVISFVLQCLIAIPLGIVSATKQYSKLDYTITTLAFIGISMPSFFFAVLLQRVFSMWLGLVPLQGMVNARADYTGIMHILDMAHHFILPLVVFTILSVGSLLRYTRTNMLEVLNSDYIRTARAKGVSEHSTIYKHAFRNTLIPIVTMLGGSIPALFTGAMITEQLFAIEGVGRAAIKAITLGDIPFMMFYYMFLSLMTLVGILISDILYAVVDPRVRLS